jgi:hypothetical protein
VHDEGTQAFGAHDEGVQAEPPPEPEPAWEEQPQAVPQYTLHLDATRTGFLQDVRYIGCMGCVSCYMHRPRLPSHPALPLCM